MKDDLGDRMKANYEDRTRMYLPRRTNTIIRIDGKAFHTFTRKLQKPFDRTLIGYMQDTAKQLCKEIQGAKLGYVQSDEISILLTDYDQLSTDAWFDGNIQKIVSISASIATATFNRLWAGALPAAHFDSRVFTIPEKEEVANYFLWRSQDAARNSVQMFARAYFSHKELEGKSITDIHEMLYTKNLNWAHLDSIYKQGTIIQRDNAGHWAIKGESEPLTYSVWKKYIDTVTTFNHGS